MRPRWPGFFLALALCAACSASPPAPTPTEGQPSAGPPTAGMSGQPTPGTSGQPTATTSEATPTPTASGSQTTPEPTPPLPPDEGLEPLPGPELATADEISQVLYDPAYAEVAVVSVLDQLGIGIYQPDGSVVRSGEETSDSDLYLFEPEVRGLIDLLLSQDSADGWIEFRDFHAALAGLGFQGSAEDLAQAYSESYAAQPDAPISQFVGYIDVNAPIQRFSAWLLFVDGFVPESGGAQAIASTSAAFGPLIAAGRSRRVARPRVQALSPSPLAADPLIVAHVIASAKDSSMHVTAEPGFAHEGHGVLGPTISVTAWLQSAASSFRSPISGRSILPVTTTPSDVPLNWELDDVFYEHGSFTPTAEFMTNAVGEAHLVWQVRLEPGDNQGYKVSQTGYAVASVESKDFISKMYGVPELGALVPGEIKNKAPVTFEWHEPEAMSIVLKNHYDVTIAIGGGIGATTGVGDDEFSGVITKQDDGTWQGVVVGTAVGQQDSQAFGAACTARWNATQKVLVVAGEDPGAQYGDFTFTFFPITEPTGPTGRGRCPPSRWRSGGVSYAPYGDYNIHQADAGLGLTIVLPQKPGAHVRVPVPPIPGSGITINDAYWDIDIQFLGPP